MFVDKELLVIVLSRSSWFPVSLTCPFLYLFVSPSVTLFHYLMSVSILFNLFVSQLLLSDDLWGPRTGIKPWLIKMVKIPAIVWIFAVMGRVAHLYLPARRLSVCLSVCQSASQSVSPSVRPFPFFSHVHLFPAFYWYWLELTINYTRFLRTRL